MGFHGDRQGGNSEDQPYHSLLLPSPPHWYLLPKLRSPGSKSLYIEGSPTCACTYIQGLKVFQRHGKCSGNSILEM